jgi:hypothetical protein
MSMSLESAVPTANSRPLFVMGYKLYGITDFLVHILSVADFTH